MIQREKIELSKDLSCYHCGEICRDDSISINEKTFCCSGCKSVFEILNSNDLCTYYNYNDSPGQTKNNSIKKDYSFLDIPEIQNKLIDYSNNKYTSATLFIPTMHCSSCIWILENLYKLNPGIIFSKVDFLKKSLEVKFMNEDLNLRELIILLDSIGYEPEINYSDTESKRATEEGKKLYYKLGIAGFAFGNVMLLSFPEYLGISEGSELSYYFFGYINIFLALPVLLYSASDYFIAAIKGLRKNIINIDVPIALGILVLFLRSAFEIIYHSGAGYFDSMTGLVFFLLTGKLFQNKTYASLSFERDYRSYFPLAVNIIKDNERKPLSIDCVKLGHRVLVRNNEIVPADSILMKGSGLMDYSFVTGESNPVPLNEGDRIYAGGKQMGSKIEVELIKEVSNSYLTQLWNNETFTKSGKSGITSLTNKISKYFTLVILAIAGFTFLYWLPTDTMMAFNSFTAVLIVACPCALALAAPYTLGNTLRIFGRNKLFLKNSSVIESLSLISKIIFDKTGTLTESGTSEINYFGKKLDSEEISLLRSVTENSTHPKSRMLNKYYSETDSLYLPQEFTELPGKGLKAVINNKRVLLGTKKFLREELNIEESSAKFVDELYFVIGEEIKGYYKFDNKYRKGLRTLISELRKRYKLGILSGDNEQEREHLISILGNEESVKFNKSPMEKLEWIKEIKMLGDNVLMIGDGLNDAGALKAGDVGIAVTENSNNFTPASDGILDSKSFDLLNKFLSFSRLSLVLVKISFVISFLYNIVGLSFAVTGNLSPIVAAILMPLSSISVVIFSITSTNILAGKNGL